MQVPTLEQKLAWLKPTPPTDDERKCAEKVGVGNYEIGFQRTNDILDEGMEIFQRSCRGSFGVAGDSIIGLFTANGDLANGASGTYLHSIIPTMVIKYVSENFSDDPGIKDGDLWAGNDALYGGIHNPDLMVAMPIFFKEKLIGWTCALTHTSETGACEPGGMPIGAKSRFEEGMNLPPMKVGENFHLRPDIEQMFMAFGMRAPQMIVVDLKARCTAADRVRKRVVEMCGKEGEDFVIGLFSEMVRRAESAARNRIKTWPDGKYRCVNFADSLGFDQALIRNCYMTMTKEDDRLTIDFEGTSPENPTSYNAHPQAVVGHMTNYIYEYAFHDLPVSNGTFASIDFKFPKGSCLYPDERAATSCAVMIATGAMSAIHNCVAKTVFSTGDWQQAAASQANAGNGLIIAGETQWGAPFVDMMPYALNTEGQGGKPKGDGIDAFGFAWCAFGRASDVEMMENETPMLIPLTQFWSDSCGHGKNRGGTGTAQLWVTHGVSSIFFTAISDNSKIQTPQPLFGGYAPCTVPGIGIRNADIVEKMRNGDDINLDIHEIIENHTINGDWEVEFQGRGVRSYQEDDVITIGFSTGGAGYGDPLERDPDAVLEDVTRGFVSENVARNVYKVVCSRESGKLDQDATAELRATERTRRLKEGRSFDDFEAEWNEKKPREDILEWFGSWPDGAPQRPVIRP